MSRSETFKARLDDLDAQWMTWRDVEVVGDFGDPHRAYQCVRNGGVGLVDHSYRDTLVISGQDAVKWLQGLVTSDLLELVDEGNGQQTLVLNHLGRFVATARLLHMPDMLVLDAEPGVLADGLMGHLRRHIITEDVNLAERSQQSARLGVYGPKAAELLAQLCETDQPVGALGEYAGTWGALGAHEVVIQRDDLTGGPCFEVMCDTDVAHEIWTELLAADSSLESGGSVEPVGFETVETLRIEAGVPRFGKELTDKRIPLEAQLERMISFEKGCYLGQEIIARLDTQGTPARLLRTLVFDGGAAPAEQANVEVDGRKAGQVVSSTWSPRLERPIALAYVKRAHNDVGGEVDVEGRTARIEALGYPLASGPGTV